MSYTDKILEDLESQENGYFQIENQKGIAYLRVTKPGSKGKKAETKDVLARLQLFGVEGYTEERIKKIVLASDGKTHEVGSWSQGIVEPAQAEIEVSEDKMFASLKLIPPKFGGESVTAYLLEKTTAPIRYGMDPQILSNLIRNPIFFTPILIAKGKAASPPQDETFIYFFRTDNKPKLEEDDRGKVDFKEIDMIQSIDKGQVLAQKKPASPGSIGYNVLGEEIPVPDPKSIEWKLGENVEIRGDQAFALIAGRPNLDRQGKLKVEEVIKLSSVDYSTGNIDFAGTIIVEDHIADGFRLEVAGSLIIKNSIGKCTLRAKGDIVLAGGFMGKGEGIVESEGNITAKFVEQAKILAQGNIRILEASLHSELSSGDSITVMGGRGEIIGGVAIAGDQIHCSKLGAVVETKTKISVGTPPDLLEELNKMKRETVEKEDLQKKVNLTLQKLNETSQIRDLSREEKDTLSKLKEAQDKLSQSLDTLKKQFDTALGSFQPKEKASVIIEKELHPGVEISFGQGKVFRVPLNPLTGKYIIQLGLDGNPSAEKQFGKSNPNQNSAMN